MGVNYMGHVGYGVLLDPESIPEDFVDNFKHPSVAFRATENWEGHDNEVGLFIRNSLSSSDGEGAVACKYNFENFTKEVRAEWSARLAEAVATSGATVKGAGVPQWYVFSYAW